jgi:hypothetical protein
MTYQPFAISRYKTGLDAEVQPWLLPDDAFVELLDGFVDRGVTRKRRGYSGFATGAKSTATESRMVHQIALGYSVSGDIDGVNKTYTISIIPPIVPTTLTITGSNPVQVMVDDGLGAFTGAGTGTVNYVTGAVSITFTAAPVALSTITLVYSNFSIGTGSASYGPVTLTNLPVRRGTVVITSGAQVLTDDGVGGFTGDGTGAIDYTTGAVSVNFNVAIVLGVIITVSYDYHQGLPVMGVMNFYPSNNVRQLIVADTTYVNRYNPNTDILEDISTTTYNGGASDFWSWVNYEDNASAPRLLFCNGVVGDVIQAYDGTTIANYALTFAGGTLNARQMFNIRDRLVLFQTIEAGVLKPRRIRISGTGANVDVFDNTATGAGFIDIPDNTWFFGAAFNRDDVLFFTESSTWMLKYTGNDVTPFILEKIDVSRGSAAAFSVLSYLNRTIAASPQGLIISDGYKVERMDNTLPNFAFENIDTANFDRCFSGFVDQDRDVYLIYPSQGVIKPSEIGVAESDRILSINFEEDNYAIYRIPLSCMGNFRQDISILWSDLTAANGFPNWDSLAAKYSNWNSFPFTKGSPISIGGGHKGEIWKLGETGSEDNPQKIRAISKVGTNHVRVTTDWNNYSVGDYIGFEAVGGMTQLSDKQAAISSVVTPYQTFDVEIVNNTFSAYTSGGIASKTIPFEALTKKLNPWVTSDKKVKCGWVYFYVSTAETSLTDGSGNLQKAFLEIEMIRDDIDLTSTTLKKYLVDCTNLDGFVGSKKWVKIWINQTARFLQFRMKNNQAGAQIKVHAMVLGLQPIGRLV